MARVHVTDNPALADVSVQLVATPGLADLLIYRDDADCSGLSSETIWSYVPDPRLAGLTVHFRPIGRGQSDLKIAFVKARGLAGWMRPHRLKGRLERGRSRSAYC